MTELYRGEQIAEGGVSGNVGLQPPSTTPFASEQLTSTTTQQMPAPVLVGGQDQTADGGIPSILPIPPESQNGSAVVSQNPTGAVVVGEEEKDAGKETAGDTLEPSTTQEEPSLPVEHPVEEQAEDTQTTTEDVAVVTEATETTETTEATETTPEAEQSLPDIGEAEAAPETEQSLPDIGESEAAPETEQSLPDIGESEAAPEAEQSLPDIGESEAEATDTKLPEASFTPQEQNTRPRKLKDLAIGMEFDGRVTSIALYGIFVDIGLGRDGLVHISEMSDKRIDTPSDLVKEGDEVKVFVKKVDLNERRISLTMRQLQATTEESAAPRRRFRRSEPDRVALAELKVGDIVQGTITGLAPFGAFVDIGVGKDGLVHISELSENRVDKPDEAVQVGSQRNFKILEVDPEGNRISLSLRKAQRVQRMRTLSPGDIVDGKVSGLAPFGAFVDIGVGRDGLVHISQLSLDRVGRVEDVVKVGDTITVRVLEVDTQGKRISLTMRPEEPEPEDMLPDILDEPDEQALEIKAPPPMPSRRDNRRESKSSKQRGERGERGERGGGGRGSRGSTPKPLESYVAGGDIEEEFEGNATLEDLLTKFGGTNTRRDRRRRVEGDDDEIDRFVSKKKQREAIQRTLQQRGDDE